MEAPTEQPIARKPRVKRPPKQPTPPPEVAPQAPAPGPTAAPEAPHSHPKGGRCGACGQKQRVKKPPTAKQLESRQQFAKKAREAKELRDKEGGKYRDAMKRVYGK